MKRAAFAVSFILLGCGPPPAAAPTPAPEPFAAAQPAVAPSSPACSVSPGRSSQKVTVGELERSYETFVGADVGESPPLLLVWHGWGSNPEMMLGGIRPEEHWNDAVVISAQGMDRGFEELSDEQQPGWQVAAQELGDRDLQLFDALVGIAKEQYCVDSSRIYSTGFSNGGFFSNLLACVRGEVVAAAAPVGGGGPFPNAQCGPAVPISITHGTADKVVDFKMAATSYAHWRKHNGCTSGEPPTEGCANAEGCPAEAPVQMCAFDGGHRWQPDVPARVATFLREHKR